MQDAHGGHGGHGWWPWVVSVHCTVQCTVAMGGGHGGHGWWPWLVAMAGDPGGGGVKMTPILKSNREKLGEMPKNHQKWVILTPSGGLGPPNDHFLTTF
jgi:hypothetical protein